MAIQGTREQLAKQKMFMTKVLNSNLKASHLSGLPRILLLAGNIYDPANE